MNDLLYINVISHFSDVWLFATLWTICSLPASSVHEILQARILEWDPLGNLPESGIEPKSPVSPALHMDSLSTEPFGKPHFIHNSMYMSIPVSQFIPPPLYLLGAISLFSTSVMLLHCFPFFLLNAISWHGCITVCLTIFPVKDISTISRFWLL